MLKKLIVGAGFSLLAGCSPDKMLKDEAINPEIKTEIRKLDNQVLNGFARNDPQKIIALSGESFLRKGYRDIGSLVEQFGRKINPKKFRILNQFYVKQNSPEEPDIEVTSGKSSEHDYTLSFPLTNTERFITVGYFEDGLEAWAFTTVYGMEDNQWKLNNIQVGLLKIAGKDAVDWYHQGKDNFQHGYLVDAVSAITLSTRCLRPANHFWHYRTESDMSSFRGPLQHETAKLYTFPVRVKAVVSAPEIFEIFPQGLIDGYYPTIYYTTKLNLRDTVSLSKECDKMHQGIGQLFKGLDLNNQYIIYRAFEFVPAGKENVRSHRFVRKGRKMVPESGTLK